MVVEIWPSALTLHAGLTIWWRKAKLTLITNAVGGDVIFHALVLSQYTIMKDGRTYRRTRHGHLSTTLSPRHASCGKNAMHSWCAELDVLRLVFSRCCGKSTTQTSSSSTQSVCIEWIFIISRTRSVSTDSFIASWLVIVTPRALVLVARWMLMWDEVRWICRGYHEHWR